MPYKIVGISGSPVKEGNTDALLASILTAAEEKGFARLTAGFSGAIEMFRIFLLLSKTHLHKYLK